MKGRVHSFQSLGAVDGPGLRYVVFLQGCTLRCAYCHNPDTWGAGGEEYGVDEILARVERCRPYFSNGGGVTVSGGEPLLQWRFVAELFSRLRREGIRTALDTAGVGDPEGKREVLKYTDLVICDLKAATEEGYRSLCGGSLFEVSEFLALTETSGVPLWVRHVVVPGLTDGGEEVKAVAKMASKYKNLERLELLPFRKLCAAKYGALGLEFPFAGRPECPECAIEGLYKLLADSGFSGILPAGK